MSILKLKTSYFPNGTNGKNIHYKISLGVIDHKNFVALRVILEISVINKVLEKTYILGKFWTFSHSMPFWPFRHHFREITLKRNLFLIIFHYRFPTKNHLYIQCIWDMCMYGRNMEKNIFGCLGDFALFRKNVGYEPQNFIISRWH